MHLRRIFADDKLHSLKQGEFNVAFEVLFYHFKFYLLEIFRDLQHRFLGFVVEDCVFYDLVCVLKHVGESLVVNQRQNRLDLHLQIRVDRLGEQLGQLEVVERGQARVLELVQEVDPRVQPLKLLLDLVALLEPAGVVLLRTDKLNAGQDLLARLEQLGGGVLLERSGLVAVSLVKYLHGQFYVCQRLNLL